MTAIAAQTRLQPDYSRRYSVAEYLKIEQLTGEKHYYIHGKLIPMAGGTLPHNRITGNIYFELRTLLSGRRDVEVFNSDQKIYLPDLDIFNYADACAVFGEPIISKKEPHALTNPVLIVETLSTSTMGYDQKQKFEEYKTLPSFIEYALISQSKPEVEVYFHSSGFWLPKKVYSGLHNEVIFTSVDVVVPLSKIYQNVQF